MDDGAANSASPDTGLALPERVTSRVLSAWRGRGTTNRHLIESALTEAGARAEVIDVGACSPRRFVAACRTARGVVAVAATFVADQDFAGKFLDDGRLHIAEEGRVQIRAFRRCPERILGLLDPPEVLYPTDTNAALNCEHFRRQIREHHARRRANPTVRPGDLIQFRQPLRFTDGSQLAVLEFQKGATFRSPAGDRYHVTNWRDREWIVLPRGEDGRVRSTSSAADGLSGMLAAALGDAA